MSTHERVYRALLIAHPKAHRQEYGEAMVQLMRDRVRDDGGGKCTVMIWAHLLVDLAHSAFIERTEIAMKTLRSEWWQFAAAAVAIVLAAVGFSGLFDPTSGPWYKWVLGRSVVAAAPLVIAAGLILRRRNRRLGSSLTGFGVLPGVAAVALFWHPIFLLFGLFSIAALVGAVNDADRARVGLASITPTAH